MLAIAIKKAFKKSGFRIDLNFSLPGDVSRAIFFGPSGSGKTLSMKAIAGLAMPDSGSISLLGRELYNSQKRVFIPPQKRNIGYMPQDYALFPHLSALENVAYPCGRFFAAFPGKKARAEAKAILERFEIGKLANCRPCELSGGQRQRVALARAVCAKPDCLMLDEPFSALDPLMRRKMRAQTLRILESLGIPAIIITHDPEDVEAFAGALVLFRSGRAKVTQNWHEIRAGYSNAAEALESVQASAPIPS